MGRGKNIHRRGRRERRGALFFFFTVFRTIPEDNKKFHDLTTEDTENTELVSGLFSVSSVLSVVYYLSLIEICILLVNIVWFLTMS
jgi:hypothetical protein